MIDRGADNTKRDPTLIGLVVVLVFVAWLNRFIQDDAFISFQYARNLVEGNGLTFNPGEQVEGYTNFLWTLLMSLGIRVGVEPVIWSYLLGLSCFAASLAAVYRLTRGLSGSRSTALAATGLLGTNFTFSAYATGGLETQLQAFLVIAAVLLSWKASRSVPPSIALLAVASCVYGLAIMTRLDSVVILLLPGILTLTAVVRSEGRLSTKISSVAALCVPAFLLVAPWFAWKLSYYGDILPNTFYVKVASAASLVRGAHYVYRFFAGYWFLPLIIIALLARPAQVWATLRRREAPWGATLVASGLLWCAYVAYVGGDFMEFRFMVPALPLFMVVFAWCLFEVVDNRQLRGAVLVVVVLGSLLHGATFWGVRDIESVRSLEIHMEAAGGDWDEVGRTLGRHFAADSGVLIAVGPAGAIPYYSRLPTVDMRGLVDPWVARNGIVVSTVPGHQRMAPLDYLVERGVNLLVGHPQVVPRAGGLPDAFSMQSLGQFGLVDASQDSVPAAARILAIPMPADRYLLVLYLVGNGRVDRAITENGWLTVPLDDGVEGI